MRRKEIETRQLSELRENPSNARTHSDRQIDQIANSIRAFGFTNPVLVDETGTIIAGHGRVRAATKLGLTEVPVILIDYLDEAQKRAYILADNRLAELAGWDSDILAIELQHLLNAELDFEITDLGFEAAQIDLILSANNECGDADPADAILPAVEAEPVTEAGDLWQIGDHRLFCGNALQSSSYNVLLGTETAAVVFTDPPYNLSVAQISGLGKAEHSEFKMAYGEMTSAEYTRFLSEAFRQMARASSAGSLHYVCIDWRHLLELLRAGRIAYSELKNLCVWVKSAGGMGALYRSRHELIAVFKSGDAPHANNILLGRYGRNRTNVWECPGLNSFQSGREEILAMHPTIKPVGLIADAILDSSARGDIVRDPFVGSGTTILAAQRTGRTCYAMELDRHYVDVALRRVRQATGIEPVCAKTGRTFADREVQILGATPHGSRGG